MYVWRSIFTPLASYFSQLNQLVAGLQKINSLFENAPQKQMRRMSMLLMAI